MLRPYNAPGTPTSGAGSSSNGNTQPGLPGFYDPTDGAKNITTGSSYDRTLTATNDSNQGTSTATKKQTATGEKFNPSDMLEKVVRLGNSSYKIKAYVPCGGKQLFALESEKPLRGYD
ncbi:unnamed protein product, partial [Rotaria socialis]